MNITTLSEFLRSLRETVPNERGSLTLQQDFSLGEAAKYSASSIFKTRDFYYFMKRLIDIFGSAIALILISPFVFILAVLIRLDSPGNPFFIQNRVGTKRVKVNGHTLWQKTTFKCYKFRTMNHGADTTIHQRYIQALINHDQQQIDKLQNGDSKVKKLVNDSRVTRVGKFLRKTSLDELPQFFNVLKGDMSLVGPRPAIPYELDNYKPWYHERLRAKPGLTGLWQVSARCEVDFDGMVRLDINYIERQSFLMDLIILLKTPLAVISRKGAA